MDKKLKYVHTLLFVAGTKFPACQSSKLNFGYQYLRMKGWMGGRGEGDPGRGQSFPGGPAGGKQRNNDSLE
jgi:hypothetical protein